jgi:hypothetical protein
MHFKLGAERQFTVDDGNVSLAVQHAEHARLLDRRMFAALFPDARIEPH